MIWHSIANCYRSTEKHMRMNIEFYDYFIICLFLFYDRFYRSFGFYDSVPAFFLLFGSDFYSRTSGDVFLTVSSAFTAYSSTFQFFFGRFSNQKLITNDFRGASETQKSKNLSELAQCNFNWCLYRNDFYQTNHKIRFSLFWIKACGKSIIKNKYHRLYIIYCVVWFKSRLCMRAAKAHLHVFERNSNKNSNNQLRA